MRGITRDIREMPRGMQGGMGQRDQLDEIKILIKKLTKTSLNKLASIKVKMRMKEKT